MRFFDLHCDTLYKMTTENKDIYKNDFNVDIERSLKYCPYVGCFAVWIPDEIRGDEAFDFFNRAVLKLSNQEKLYKKYFKICKSFKDIDNLNLEKRQGIVLTVEGGGVIGGKIENLKKLYDAGVKIMTLTWNGRCEIGSGANFDEGLTDFGYEVVKEVEKIGIIIDISHASEKLFYDVSKVATKPFIATHSNSKVMCNHRRNLTDEQFRTIKSVGGLVGITFCSYFLSDKDKVDFDQLEKHIEHFLELGGEDFLALGSDFDGAELPYDISGIESIENIYEYFLKRNYGEVLLDKIFFKNAYNFMKINMR